MAQALASYLYFPQGKYLCPIFCKHHRGKVLFKFTGKQEVLMGKKTLIQSGSGGLSEAPALYRTSF